jgi:hypothetical protein
MKKLVLLFLIAACWRTKFVEKPVVRIERRDHWAACLVSPPPKAPIPSVPPSLTLMSIQDWEDIERAKWADYGHAAATWIDRYAWPRCQFDEKTQQFK